MGATFKGGNNNEHHNHNDLGSYTIVVGNELLMGDPGLATYTPTYFKKERYDLYKTTASYGHPVPLVAGTQQYFGKEAEAKIIQTDYKKDKDVFVMDITSAYHEPCLKKLVRSFTYDRTSNGYIKVTDMYAYNSNQSFETALITRAGWKIIGPGEIELTGKKEKLVVHILTPGNTFTITSEVIDEGPTPYTRLAIKLKAVAERGSVVMTFKPKKQE
jgi:hypothetical protein